jgi:carboxymethylenebutenolidase
MAWWTDEAAKGDRIGGRITFLAAAERSFGRRRRLLWQRHCHPAQRFADRLPSLPPAAGRLRTPWLGLFGDLDHTIPVQDVEKLHQELAPARVATDIIRYPDARHAVHCDERRGYVAAATVDAWARKLDWFETHTARPGHQTSS